MRKTIALLVCIALSGCINSAYQQGTDEPVAIDLEVKVSGQDDVAVTSALDQEPMMAVSSITPTLNQMPPNATVIEIPAQPLYITDAGVMSPQPVMTPQVALITLQTGTNPVQYTQCISTDIICLNNAYTQGFMSVQYAPQFAGYQDVLGPSDYPAGGRWRNSNNIPRW